MPFSVQLGLFFALCTALGSVLGFFLKYKGAVVAPAVNWRRPLHSTAALFRSPIYTIGCVVATTSWGFHVAALALAPISVVQSVIAGGLVLVTVVGDRFFGQSVTRREWIGVALTAAGLAFLAATLEGTTDSAHADYDGYALFGVLVVTTCGAIVLAMRNSASGPALAVSAGLLWAGSDITIKALSNHTDMGWLLIIHPFAFIILIWSLVGLLVSARSLQIGPVVPVIAITSATANMITIAAGPTVFKEPLPADTGDLVLRLAAFVLVITAAALTPPPGTHSSGPAV